MRKTRLDTNGSKMCAMAWRAVPAPPRSLTGSPAGRACTSQRASRTKNAQKGVHTSSPPVRSPKAVARPRRHAGPYGSKRSRRHIRVCMLRSWAPDAPRRCIKTSTKTPRRLKKTAKRRPGSARREDRGPSALDTASAGVWDHRRPASIERAEPDLASGCGLNDALHLSATSPNEIIQQGPRRCIVIRSDAPCAQLLQDDPRELFAELDTPLIE
jgi:hypothetical protein